MRFATSARCSPTTQAHPARFASTTTPPTTSRSSATAPTSRSPGHASSSPAPSTGGRPGSSSISDLLVACLGDSITEGSPYWESRRGSGDPEGQWEYWAQLSHPELTIANHGIYGQRTDEIARRFDEAVAGAEVLIVQGGINDIAQGRPIAAAAATLAGLVERGRALGLRVAV